MANGERGGRGTVSAATKDQSVAGFIAEYWL
jgi:hypothetical protein